MCNNELSAGFAKVDITPPLGVCMAGYFSRRESTGIASPLYAFALAISNGKHSWVLISCDLIGVDASYLQPAKDMIRQQLGMCSEQVLIHCTHTHTGPVLGNSPREEGQYSLGQPDEAYISWLQRKLADVARMACDDLQNATLAVGSGEERSISFIRRYRMTNRSVMTNPGIGNPDIIEPIGEIDPTVGVIEFKRSYPNRSVLLVNFALHADTVGGTLFSSDYPGFMRTAVQAQMPDHDVIYFNGASGDINHIDAQHPGSTGKGLDYTAKIGRILAGEVLKICQRMKTLDDVHQVKFGSRSVRVPLRTVSRDQVEAATCFIEQFQAGHWQTKNMNDVADIAAAYQTVKLSRLGDSLTIDLQYVAVGKIAIIALPGEVFVDIGRKIKAKSPFTYTYISSISNGSVGYFPTAQAFKDGGYETKNNPFTDELEELVVQTAVSMLA